MQVKSIVVSVVVVGIVVVVVFAAAAAVVVAAAIAAALTKQPKDHLSPFITNRAKPNGCEFHRTWESSRAGPEPNQDSEQSAAVTTHSL